MKILEIKCSTLSLLGSEFVSVQIGEISTRNCFSNYYVFEDGLPYLPIPNGKAEAICELNDDYLTASWNITKYCEPSCLIREGGCDHNQTCTKPSGEDIDRCICAGYTGKYCETIDLRGFDFSFSLFYFN